MSAGVPTGAVQNLLEVAMGRLGIPPRVILLEQEAFSNTAGSRLLPAIIHTPESQIIRRGQRGQKVIRAVFTVRILSKTPDELDDLHASVAAVAEQVSKRLDIALLTAARDDELGAYWRTISLSVPGRGLRQVAVPRTRRAAIRWGDGVRLTWGGFKRLAW